MKKLIELKIKGIKCDNPSCDFRDNTVEFKDYKKWLNKSCPKCGQNLLTKADHRSTKFLIAMVNTINFFSPVIPKKFKEKKKMVQADIHMNGSGKMDFELKHSNNVAQEFIEASILLGAELLDKKTLTEKEEVFLVKVEAFIDKSIEVNNIQSKK